jgi:peptidoglycan-associated lipoprotein
MNHRSLLIVLAAFSLSFSVGCAHRKTTEEQAATTDSGSADKSSASTGAISEDEVATLHRNFKRVLFDFDTATLTEGARAALAENATILRLHPEVAVRIEGHTDHFGSDEYNLALG